MTGNLMRRSLLRHRLWVLQKWTRQWTSTARMQLKKVAVLNPLAFGTRVTLDQVLRLGVQKLELLDLQVASELGYRVSCCPHRGY